VYPQGSVRLGTVVRPRKNDEYDLDTVAEYDIDTERITKERLKELVGDALTSYVDKHAGDPGEPTNVNPGKRCWTLEFDEPFHMDVLPAIPDPDARPHGIQITDREMYQWQPSNPIGFANWFYDRLGPQFKAARIELAKRAQVNVDDLPPWQVERTILQRAVQVLKLHRNTFFADDLTVRPPSIIVTTLAGHAYRGQPNLFEAVAGIANDMTSYIESDGALYIVRNPVHEEENFADRWGAEPDRARKFFEWVDDLNATLDAAYNERGGLKALATRIEKSFGVYPADTISQLGDRYKDDRRSDRLRVATTGLVGSSGMRVRDHTFHGEQTP
jgi:hypothetical protein